MGFRRPILSDRSSADGTRNGPANDHDGGHCGCGRRLQIETHRKKRHGPQTRERNHGADEPTLCEKDQPGVSVAKDFQEPLPKVGRFCFAALLRNGSCVCLIPGIGRVVLYKSPGEPRKHQNDRAGNNDDSPPAKMNDHQPQGNLGRKGADIAKEEPESGKHRESASREPVRSDFQQH